MSKLIETFKMETNFEGLIKLLADHLYSEPDVFIRELIQNAHDAIQMRLELEPDLAGHIDVNVDKRKKTITFCDNGIGMDKKDIKEFLSVIGESGKSSLINEFKTKGQEIALKLIGQFGIGILSAFVVAKKVIVRTLKAGIDKAFAWHNEGSLECDLFEDNLNHVGAEVTIEVNKDFEFMLEDERIIKLVQKYCDFIPFVIKVNGKGPVNELDVPFYRNHWNSNQEKESKYDLFVYRRFQDDIPLDVIPVEIDEPIKARGVLYISHRNIPGIYTAGQLEIFIKRVFIKANDSTLLPEWANFVRGVIDCPHLIPTAARDNVKREHSSFDYLKDKLGEIIVQRLMYLAENQREVFSKINFYHNYSLKGMACLYDDFFEKVGGLILFKTNKGKMQLRDYLTKNEPRLEYGKKIPIYYFSQSTSTSQFYALANAKNWVVIEASQIFDISFLKKYEEANSAIVILINLDTTDDPAIFEKLDEERTGQFHQLEIDLEGHLKRIGVNNVLVRTRDFAPSDIPAIIIEEKVSEKMRKFIEQEYIWESIENITDEALGEELKHPFYLNLNASNRLIQELAKRDRKDELSRQILTGIYNCAMIYAHNFLTRHNTKVIHDQFVKLFNKLLVSQEEFKENQRKLEQARRELLEIQKKDVQLEAQRPDHILIFMITPFDDKYKNLEEALRLIFECPPYYFELRLARDYHHSTNLLSDIKIHMTQAHAFIAEISELNANVMFELGAVLLPDDHRPVFCLRSQDALKNVPADLKEKLYIDYTSLSDSFDNLAAELRSKFERDGRPIHKGLKDLLSQQKQRYLSRKLLENLGVRVDNKSIETLRSNYKTIEELLKADKLDVIQQTGLKDYLVEAMIGELKTA